MRPTVVDTGGDVYECPGCGRRERAPETTVCARCGSAMYNIGHDRDL